jgi:hypothetical protein
MAKDEAYIIDLCDRVLGRKAVRQHPFDFLRGDPGRPLRVDAYYPDPSCNRRVGKHYLPPGARYFGCRHCYDFTPHRSVSQARRVG